MTFRVTVVSGPQAGTTWELSEPEAFLVGRDESCHCRLSDDASVSRNHFLLESNPPLLTLRDLSSYNGTVVNDRLLGGPGYEGSLECELTHGDLIRVGDHGFRVEARFRLECGGCGRSLAPDEQSTGTWEDSSFRCRECFEAGMPSRRRADSGGRGETAEILTTGSIDPSTRTYQMPAPEPLHPGGPIGIPGYEFLRNLSSRHNYRVDLCREGAGGTEVVVKVFRARPGDFDRRLLDRFLREIEILTKMSHRNVVRLLDHGNVGRDFYFVTEYHAAGSVRDLLDAREWPLTPEEAVSLILDALEGLIHLHAQGVVHRDFRPANLLVSRHSLGLTTRIADFGLAKNFLRAGLSEITLSGTFSGCSHYVPPEQITAFRYAQPVTDVFGAGATLYHLLTGRYVYELEDGANPVSRILEGCVVRLATLDTDLPSGLVEVVDRAIDPDPGARIQSAAELRQAILINS